MLVLANGAFKSGSTWLQAILKQMGGFDEVPPRYRSARHQQAWLDRGRARAFLESDCYLQRDILSKGHFGEPRYRELFLSYPNVKVVGIERDIRDTIVSHYFHFLRERRVEWDFHRYYWRVGRYKAFQVREYHDTWRSAGEAVYISSFERLKNDFHHEVERIADFVGRDLSASQIERIRTETSLEALQRKHGQVGVAEEQRFFRRGEIGEWRNHFDEAKLNDIDRIERQGLDRLDRSVYHLLFSFRPALNRLMWSSKALVKASQRHLTRSSRSDSPA